MAQEGQRYLVAEPRANASAFARPQCRFEWNARFI